MPKMSRTKSIGGACRRRQIQSDRIVYCSQIHDGREPVLVIADQRVTVRAVHDAPDQHALDFRHVEIDCHVKTSFPCGWLRRVCM